MVQRVSTVAFEGIEARGVDVQVQVAPGLPAFAIAGLINRPGGDNRPIPVANDRENLLSPVGAVLVHSESGQDSKSGFALTAGSWLSSASERFDLRQNS